MTAPTRTEAAVYIRRIRNHRILYGVCLAAALLFLFLLVVNFIRNTFLACAVLIIGAILCLIPYARLSLKNETSIASILKDDLDPELFSLVFRQTLAKRSQFPSVQAMMEVTEKFYLGEYAHVLRALAQNPELLRWTQPEFVSYYVQSACAMGYADEAEKGLSILAQAHLQKEYEDPAVAAHLDLYENLAKAAYHLVQEESAEALSAARAVYEDAAAPQLIVLYAAAYYATACALQGQKDEALRLRAEVLEHSPAFGIVRHLSGKEN